MKLMRSTFGLVRRNQRYFSSTNPEEIKKFSEVKDWWSTDGSMSVLHEYNKVRIDFIKKCLRRHMDSKKY